ncbi:MAG: hypothetical protein WC979_01050 [Candidatus Pacearchaeota archaeon]|jgi:hypothetical protein|nr:hypothetical protein [Clostridia bacterium]
MKEFIVVQIQGAAKDKLTIILETDNHFKIRQLLDDNGFGDYKVKDWYFTKGKIFLK